MTRTKKPAMTPLSTFPAFEPEDVTPMHYFSSSAGEWRVDVDLGKLITTMKRSGLTFNVFLVKLPLDANYPINMYRPDLPSEQVQWVAAYQAG